MPKQKDPRLAQFAQQLLVQVRASPDLGSLVFYLKPDNSLDSKTNKPGVKYSFMFREHETEVVLYFDTRNKIRNKALFDELAREREAIETVFEGSLDWRRQDGAVEGEGNTVVSRIRKIVTGRGYLDDRWPETRRDLLETMHRLYKATATHIS